MNKVCVEQELDLELSHLNSHYGHEMNSDNNSDTLEHTQTTDILERHSTFHAHQTTLHNNH